MNSPRFQSFTSIGEILKLKQPALYDVLSAFMAPTRKRAKVIQLHARAKDQSAPVAGALSAAL